MTPDEKIKIQTDTYDKIRELTFIIHDSIEEELQKIISNQLPDTPEEKFIPYMIYCHNIISLHRDTIRLKEKKNGKMGYHIDITLLNTLISDLQYSYETLKSKMPNMVNELRNLHNLITNGVLVPPSIKHIVIGGREYEEVETQLD